jgi:hypothetical protein
MNKELQNTNIYIITKTKRERENKAKAFNGES